MAKHTPGPWEAYHVTSAGWSVRKASPREGYSSPDPVCNMAWWQFDIPGIIDNEISGANAKLIAAAPDLLEHLKHMVWLVETELKEDGGHIVQGAKDAIAKASE